MNQENHPQGPNGPAADPASQAYYQAFGEQSQAGMSAVQPQQQYQAYQPVHEMSDTPPQQAYPAAQYQEYYSQPPPPSLPPRHQQEQDQHTDYQSGAVAELPGNAPTSMAGYPSQPNLGPGLHETTGNTYQSGTQSGPVASTGFGGTGYQPPPPPRRKQQDFGEDDPANPIHYTRDPHKLIAYLVPFPKPLLKDVDPAAIPDRFLMYTPPPPPLSKPKEGDKEEKLHKVQRKWQEEVREAKTSTAKTASWKGVKGKATKGIDWAMSKTTGSNLDFLNRIPGSSSGKHAPTDSEQLHEGTEQDAATKKTVGLEEMILVYPTSIPGNQSQLREEFVNTMLRSKTKAQRDSVIATGLLPVSFAVDVLATLVWPFGGLLEIDSVWLYSSIRGAKTARATTKRLTSTAGAAEGKEAQLVLTFTPSVRLEILRTYLAAECHRKDPKLFPHAGVTAPTETRVLEAIGWAPSQTGGETGNLEDERWETEETKEDTKKTFGKGAVEWVKWCKAFEKNPEKALKK